MRSNFVISCLLNLKSLREIISYFDNPLYKYDSVYSTRYECFISLPVFVINYAFKIGIVFVASNQISVRGTFHCQNEDDGVQ